MSFLKPTSQAIVMLTDVKLDLHITLRYMNSISLYYVSVVKDD